MKAKAGTAKTWIFLGIAALSTAYRAYIPISPGYGAKHDDDLMVLTAHSILEGQWLGKYSDLGHLTLAKGPGYPLFLASTRFLPWNPLITVHILLLGGAFLLVRQVSRTFNQSRLEIPLFAFVAFFPAWFGEQMSRIYRDGFLAALTFVSLGLSVLAINKLRLLIVGLVPNLQIVLLGLATGFVFAMHTITRSLPYGLIAQLTASIVMTVVMKWNVQVLRAAVIFFLSVALGFTPLMNYVKSMNKQHYGVRLVENFYGGSFANAMKVMSSVNGGPAKKYVSITKEQRELVYSVSPTFNRLAPFLETPAGSGLKSQSCRTLSICDESAAWFPWEIRDAAESAGLASTAIEFEDTFDKISEETLQACGLTKLQCGQVGLVTGVASLSNLSKREIFEATFVAVNKLLQIESGQQSPPLYFSELSGKKYRTWNEVIRGLPKNKRVPELKPEQLTGVASLSFIRTLSVFALQVLAIGALLAGLLVINRRGYREFLVLQFGLPILIGLGINICVLALMEAGSGLYLTVGGAQYLLSVFPFFLSLITVTTCYILAKITNSSFPRSG